MIDPKELRIGAHVLYNGKRMAVMSCVSDAADRAYISLFEPTSQTHYPAIGSGDIEPIALTPELLTELGFELTTNYGGVLEYEKGVIQIQFWGDRIGFHIIVGGEQEITKRGMAIRSIRYLHELEAFLYLATKTELIKE